MLSTLPKLADKAFIIGFFFPSLLFVVLLMLVLSDAPIVSDALKDKEAFEKLAYLAVIVWALAVFLAMSNHIQFQILEGYRWPVSHIATLKCQQEKKFDKLKALLDSMDSDWKRLGDRYPTGLQSKHDALRQQWVTIFPMDRNDVLPTRFGNAIRAFETYSRHIFGADSIPLWIHLTAVIPKEFQAAVDDLRAQVNCLMNICWLAPALGVTCLARFIWLLDWHHSLGSPFDVRRLVSSARPSLLLIAIGSLVITRLAYNFSVEQIYGWGSLVKAAFDCYLPDLAKKLGYRLPRADEDRKRFWTAISRRAIFHKLVDLDEWVPTQPTDSKARSLANPDKEADANDEDEIESDEDDSGAKL
jgi:hypothetical protein